jgi:hypothetical protein
MCRHGEIIGQAERAEVKALQKRPDLNGVKAQLQEAGEPRRPAAWAAVWASLPMMSVELNQAVETALAQANPQLPAGVRAADWERVLAVRRTDPLAQADDLRRLRPEVQAGEGVASVDKIVVRRPEKRRFLELGTAFVRTATRARSSARRAGSTSAGSISKPPDHRATAQPIPHHQEARPRPYPDIQPGPGLNDRALLGSSL